MRLPLHHREVTVSRRNRGQTLVLAALSLLLLALMVALSFNLGHALRGKVRLQHHVDAQAYSMAIIEARALNYFAVSNRAVAASYVAMNSLHAHMAAASVTEAMLRAGASNFTDIAGQETRLCGSSATHCLDALQAKKISKAYSDTADQYQQQVQAMEPGFRNAVTRLDAMLDTLHQSQRGVYSQTQEVLRTGSAYGLEELRMENSPLTRDRAQGVAQAQPLPEAVGALNAASFTCAIDGMECQGREGTRAETRAKVMTEVANATRPDWTAGRTKTAHLHPRFLVELTQLVPGAESITRVNEHRGTAKTVSSPRDLHGGGREDGNPGKESAADEQGQLSTLWRHGFAENDYSASISSASTGGRHSHGHRGGRTHAFEGVAARALESCLSQRRGNCFMQFRAIPDAREDFGQPSVFAYARQQLRVDDPGQAPWQLGENGRLRFEHGEQGTAELRLAPGEGAAISRALVYYHRLGNWREPPNLFNPFWRAKLHPMQPDQATRVLRAAGHVEALPLAAEDLYR